MTELPMFPLGATLLPGESLPLRVFEPRYQALVQRCLATDRRFGVVLIERGSEVGGGDVRSDVGTVAEIVDHAATGAGRYSLECRGVARIRIAAWLPDDPYPRADVEPWPDAGVDGDWRAARDGVIEARERLLDLWRELAKRAGRRATPPPPLALPDDPSECSFTLATALPLSEADRYRALGAAGPVERAGVLTDAAEDVAAALRFRLQ
ncbi:LON peptidase substrate-binding domain-containing protein [Tsukamurella soli]